MTSLLLVPIAVLVAGFPGARWMRSRRRDEKSIRAHRSALVVIEHVAGADEIPGRGQDHTPAHVRIVEAPARRRPQPVEQEEILPSRPPRPAGRPTFPLPRDRAPRPRASG